MGGDYIEVGAKGSLHTAEHGGCAMSILPPWRRSEIIFVDNADLGLVSVSAAAELRYSGLTHWNWQHRSRGNLRPLRIARASCNSSAGYCLIGRTRDMTVAPLRMWVGRQRPRRQEFQTPSQAIARKISLRAARYLPRTCSGGPSRASANR